MLYLNKYEICLYFFIYISYLLYGVSNIYRIKDHILSVANIDFDNGWTIIGRPKDSSNDELENFKNFVSKNYYWYIIHVVSAELFHIHKPQKRSLMHGFIGCVFVIASFQMLSTLIIFCLFASYYIMSMFNSKSLMWALSGSWIFCINMIKTNMNIYEMLGYQEYYTLIMALTWGVLKCLSFCLSWITSSRKCKENWNTATEQQMFTIRNYFGFFFYFPTFIFGPFMLFRRYAVNSEETRIRCEERWRMLFVDIARTFCYFLLLDVMLHFCYVHYLERDLESIKLLPDTFGLYALGYFMGLYFFLCYAVTYGLGIAMGRFDKLDPPNRPRCIGRIHFYSDMWKYFDQGLYEFLFTYIYTEICSKTSPLAIKLLASFATFSFIYVWHGHYMYILIWSILNLCCLLLEKFFKYFVTSIWYKRKVAKYLSKGNQQRLYAFLATQVYIPSAFSNIYFIAGRNVGDYFMLKTYRSGFIYYAGLTICCYCFFQSSEVTNSWEIERSQKTAATKS